MVINIKIVIISPYRQFAENAMSISKQLNEVSIETFIGYFDEGIEYAKELEKKGCDAIISRGITAEEIRKTTKIPVFKASESIYDLIRSLHEARQIGKNINLFLYEKNPIIPNKDFHDIINETFDINLKITKYKSPRDLEEKFKVLMDDYEVIIGGAFVISLCKNFNKCGILLETGKESLFFTFEEAIRLIKLKTEETFRANQLKAILDFAYEGIISVDKNYKITLVNPMAEKLLGIRSEKVMGKSVKETIPNTRLHEIIDSGRSQLEEIQQVGNDVQIVTNRIPIIIKNEIQGAIATFKDVTHVQQIEKKIRLELNKKGSVARYTLKDIIGESEEIKGCKELVKKFGRFDSNVLINGETGTGKELFAQSIHNESHRKNAPFYAINCAALSENLLESELFGYSEGSFTGAKKGGKAGLFELAHGGTIHLDEIGEMPLTFQSKLLRVLQEKEIRRIGDEKVTPVDVRIIAASNKNIYDEVIKNNFREDLFYRISVMNLNIPPLRQRKEDIPLLLEFFIQVHNRKFKTNINIEFTDEITEFLKQYTWKGNARELQNFVEKMIVYHNDKLVTFNDITKFLPFKKTCMKQENSGGDFFVKVSGNLEDMVNVIIKETIAQFNGNQTEAAKYLGVSRTFLWRKLNNK